MWRWRGPQDTHGFFSELFIKVCFFSFFPFLFVFDCITQHEGILAPQPVIKPVPSALGVWSLDCYTTREVPRSAFFFFFSFFCSWSQTWAMTMIVIILSPDSGGGPCWGCLNQWKIWSGILSASYGLLTHFIWAPEKKIELILIIILAAPLGSMIKFKIYFSWFQEN